MKFKLQPKTAAEKFALDTYFLLVENFPETYFVGGLVRDALLGKKVTDIDIATEALPENVHDILSEAGYNVDLKHKSFGAAIASKKQLSAEITTMRTEAYKGSRYPKVMFISDLKKDSLRRDFTVNSLYLSQNKATILDFHGGLKDLRNKRIKFIGNPSVRIAEDPLRIVRAIRFCITLGFKLDPAAKRAIQNNFFQLKKISGPRLETEISKLQKKDLRRKLISLLEEPKALDKQL